MRQTASEDDHELPNPSFLPHFESKEAFAKRLLPEVSRTFALSIEALPGPLRSRVRTAYLLCRILDTVEDEVGISQERRRQLYGEFRGALIGHGDLETFRRAPEWRRTDDLPDLELCRGSHHVLSAFVELDERSRDLIRSPVLEMSEGMEAYGEREEVDGQFRVYDLPDLERYCFYVAGTVGELLTGLFISHVGAFESEQKRYLQNRAVSFGLGLQLVNILKDVEQDLNRDICFLPEDLLLASKLSRDTLMDSENGAKREEVLGVVAECARAHLERAIEYTLAWPAETSSDVRFFCAVPLGLALATLTHRAEHLTREQPMKIPRSAVMTLFSRARSAAGQNEELRALFRELSAKSPHS